MMQGNKLFRILVWDFARPSFFVKNVDTKLQELDKRIEELKGRKVELEAAYEKRIRMHRLLNRYFSLKDTKAKRKVEEEIKRIVNAK